MSPHGYSCGHGHSCGHSRSHVHGHNRPYTWHVVINETNDPIHEGIECSTRTCTNIAKSTPCFLQNIYAQ